MTTLSPDLELPQSIDSEKTILGSILLDGGVIDDLSGIITRADFYLDNHRRLYAAMQELRTDNRRIDLISLKDLLCRTGDFEQIGGAAYIGSLIDFGVASDTVRYYVRMVAEKAQLRRLITAGNRIVQIAIDQDEPVEAIQESSERLVADAATEGDNGGFQSATILGDDFLEQLQQGVGLPVPGIKTGLRDLDERLVSLEPETLTIIGARPSTGKTAMGLTVLLNALLGQDAARGCGAFFSLEMSAPQIMQRLLAMVARMDLRMLRGSFPLNRDDWAKLSDAQARLSRLPIEIDPSRGLTASQVCARLRRLHQRRPVGFAILDFLTRLRFNSKRDLRHELGDAAKTLKDIAGELHIPVIALSQLSRASVSGGKIRVPQLSDLRESGNLEEDADNVLFIHREEMYDKTDSNAGKATILIGKQRQGEAHCAVDVAFVASFVKFEDLETRSFW